MRNQGESFHGANYRSIARTTATTMRINTQSMISSLYFTIAFRLDDSKIRGKVLWLCPLKLERTKKWGAPEEKAHPHM